MEKHARLNIFSSTLHRLRWVWAGHAQANIPTMTRAGLNGESLISSLAHLQGPYRVLFRRNISLIKGCVKLTRPFLDMLVTRSLWSKMCKSMLSGFFFGPGEYLRRLSDTFECRKARPRWWRALPATGRTASRCDGLTRTKKHPTEAIWIQPTRLTVYSNKGPVLQMTHPLLLKTQAQFKCLARAANGKVTWMQ